MMCVCISIDDELPADSDPFALKPPAEVHAIEDEMTVLGCTRSVGLMSPELTIAYVNFSLCAPSKNSSLELAKCSHNFCVCMAPKSC